MVSYRRRRLGSTLSAPCCKILHLPAGQVTKEQMLDALRQSREHKEEFDRMMRQIEADPSLKNERRWYAKPSMAASRAAWQASVVERYHQQQNGLHQTCPCDLHVVRLGDIAFASNPFEYYLDFGAYIKARSKAVQTFLVQLAGVGTYVPSKRSVSGGGYGSVAATNPVGAEGGRTLAERTVELINGMWT
jgi:hypothetical protein